METEKVKRQKNIKIIIINAALLVLMLLVFIMFANTAIAQSENKITDAAEKHLTVCNTAVSAVINNNVRLVEKLGNALTFSQKDGFVADEALFSRFSDINNFCRVAMSNRNGLVTIPGYSSFDFSNRAGFMAAQSGNSYVGDPENDVFRGGTVVAVTAPLRRNGVTYNVLYGIKYVYSLEQEIREVCPSQNGEYYIIDDAGKIIFTSQDSRWQSGDDLMLEFAKIENVSSQDIADMTTAIYEKNNFQTSVHGIEGVRYILNIQPLNANKRWSIVYMQTVADTALRQRLVTLSISCVITVLTIGVLMLLINRKNTMQSQSEMKKTVITDSLTGVLNANGFFEIPYTRFLKSKDDILTAVRLDVRDFKLINDKYGFVNGDNVLKQMAKTLTECMNNDGIVARTASDNFAFVKNDDGVKFIEDIVEKLKQDLKSNVDDSLGREISFNIGAYRITDDDESTVMILDKCNIALKEAKSGLPDTVVYYSDDIMNKIREKHSMEKHMHEALENEEFRIYIQPKVRVKDRRMIGGEALIRWENPETGLIPPDGFIPLFEKNGFITELDMYILEKVMQRLEMIMHSGIKPWPISVNISRVTLSRPDFIARIGALINKYKSVKGFIELEITESVFVGDYSRMLEMLEKLKSMGMIIVMDDFGSGYSSLNLLKDVPFDVLKLDKAFFNEGNTSKRAATIIRSVVQMAKSINVQVVCEGVETEEQLALLERIGCDTAQGFYFARPMPFLKYEVLQENELAVMQ